MNAHQPNYLETAANFVNSTARHLFLTGKAGTGKTTFLRNLALKTHKSFIIVAPTGIAALNAQGVTIHSQFMLPFGSFIPERQAAGHFAENSNFYTQHTLAKKHALNKARRQVLRAADLIIIDEVSMLRADVLDAIDYRMRSVKRNFNRSFGGAQLLMIGDLFQLPPIVKDHEWSVLKNYYRSMHFFEAQALQQDGMVYIELEKIFRQKDDKFISVLNNLRNNVATADDIKLLNSHYKSPENIDEEGVITITTHNHKADTINKLKLNDLPSPSACFDAEIEGDFPEKIFPLPETIELKEGAQIMFIKNDTSGEQNYFNGKLARIEKIDDDGILVRMQGTNAPFTLVKEKWENKNFTINPDSKELEEEVVGTFVQYPVKLAWAVTVHKSQGLTFDKAIIDVGQAFAPGQVYVALSRLRSLEGLILRTRISPAAISSDEQVVTFSSQRAEEKQLLPDILAREQKEYLQRVLANTFDFSPLIKQLQDFGQQQAGKMVFEDQSLREALPNLQKAIEAETENTAKFRNQLLRLLFQNELDQLEVRLGKGVAYYKDFLQKMLGQLLQHMADVEVFTRVKKYLDGLEELDLLVMKQWAAIDEASYLASCIINKKEIEKRDGPEMIRSKKRAQLLEEAREIAAKNPKKAGGKTGRKRKPKAEKGATYKTTYALIKEGMGLKEIAESRGMAVSTIEGHAAKGVAAGEIDAADVLDKKTIATITMAFADGDDGLNAVYEKLGKKYPYDALRIVRAQLNREA